MFTGAQYDTILNQDTWITGSQYLLNGTIKESNENDALQDLEENSKSCATTVKHHDDGEPVSCYCSSSHTDNISTDEHDSLNDISISNHHTVADKIQLSDSGADLTDCFGGSDSAWQSYWSQNGERIIWESWISKYSAYINPEYLPSKQCDLLNKKLAAKEQILENTNTSVKCVFDLNPSHQDLSENNTNVDLNFTLLQLAEIDEQKSSYEVTERNRVLIRNLSGSDSNEKLTRESEGWNPLSPVSNDCETEDERLLNSRCVSRTGSAARTVDSMTNVTRLTVSSVELSDNSKNSDSFSSVSSVNSSITSTSSENILEPIEYDQQWSRLWTKHYQDEYMKHSKKFQLGNLNKLENYKESDANIFEVLPDCNVKLMEMESSPHLEDDFNVTNECEEEMNLLGLPTSFSKPRNKYNLFESSKTKLVPQNQSIEVVQQSSVNRVKAGFSLLGIIMNEGTEEKLVGSIVYKMKNIRNQNRNLKISTISDNTNMAKHIYFDDDDEIISSGSIETTVANKVSEKRGYGKLLEFRPSSSTEDEIDAKILDISHKPTETNNKRKRKRRNNLPLEIRKNPKLIKYWYKRYSLFRKFDEGIKLDEESWFSVTPELIAQNTAERCRCNILIDAFCGVGGNTIQFAYTCSKVIAIDIDEKKIEMAKHNATIYGVEDRIEFIVGDYFQLANSLTADIVFLSPPWGGPEYLLQPEYDLEMLQPKPLSQLLKTSKCISKNIALFLPKNSNTYPLVIAAGPGGSVEFEQNFLNKKLISITAYLGDLVKEKDMSAVNASAQLKIDFNI